MPKNLLARVAKVDEYTRSVWIIASSPEPVDGVQITEWELERFLKNPVILWAHDAAELPIGLANDVEASAEGLRMRVTFAREAVNPLAEQVWQGVKDGVIRSVSIGYDGGPEGSADSAEDEDEPEDDEAEVDNPAATTRAASPAARLVEVSFVPIGLDENAGTPFLNPEAQPDEDDEDDEDDLDAADEAASPTDEEMRRRVSEAARELAMHQTRKRRLALEQRADADENTAAARSNGAGGSGGSGEGHLNVPREEDGRWTSDADEQRRFDSGELVLRLDRSRLGKVDRTQVGGARVPARLTRTGVLTYVNPDGTQRRELRLPEEVFKADSLATLEHAPVIDIKDHTGLVTPETWRRVSLGHVARVRQDGKFIASDLIVQDAETLDAIETGDRSEISCGYRCRLEMTSGTYEGERFDCIQRDIRYNHAALCPPNRGRAGPEVGLRLDNQGPPWGVSHDEEQEQTMKVIRIDGREYEVGSQAHLDKLDDMHRREVDQVRNDAKAKIDKLSADLSAEKKRADEAEGARDAAKQSLDEFKADAQKAKDKDADELKKRTQSEVRSRVRLLTEVARWFGSADEDEEEEVVEEEEVDEDGKKKKKTVTKKKNPFEKLDSKSDREVMLYAIRKKNPDFDDKGKSDDYVRSRYDAMIEQVRDANGINGVRRAVVREVHNLDSFDTPNDNDPVSRARRNRDQKAASLWQTGQQQMNGGK